MPTVARFFPVCLIALLTVAGACNDPTLVGEDLIGLELDDLQFADTFDIVASVERRDSVLVYTPNTEQQSQVLLLGRADDPIFGEYGADIYIQMRLIGGQLEPFIRSDDYVIDSVRLSLAYRDGYYYGDTLAPQTLRVYRLTEAMDNTIEYYDNQTFEAETTPVGEVVDEMLRPGTDFVTVRDTIVEIGDPRLIIPLDNSLGEELFTLDTTAYDNSEAFTDFFDGFYLEADEDNTAITAFNFANTATRLFVYYTVGDTVSLVYGYDFDAQAAKVNNYQYNYEATAIDDFVDNPALSDSLIFLQGMGGVSARIGLPTLGSVGGAVNDGRVAIINKAELEATVAFLPGDDTVQFPIPPSLAASIETADGRTFVVELQAALGSGNAAIFGGIPVEEVVSDGGVLVRYRMNISDFAQEIVQGSAFEEALYLRVLFEAERANRVVLYGPGHSRFPMRLKVNYTLVD